MHGKKILFNNISLSANTATERINEWSGDIYEQLETKPHILCSLWRLMKAQTGPTVHSKSYSSELQSLCPAHDRTTAKDLLEQLGVAIMQVGLP